VLPAGNCPVGEDGAWGDWTFAEETRDEKPLAVADGPVIPCADGVIWDMPVEFEPDRDVLTSDEPDVAKVDSVIPVEVENVEDVATEIEVVAPEPIVI
jgi:hypothetical protein